MPKISLKTPEEIAIMAEGGGKLARILEEVLTKVEPGISTLEIDSWIDSLITKAGGTPSFKQVPRYHWASCVGLNQEVVHSIPKKEKIIKEGDLVKIDLGMLWQGWHTDLAWTILVHSSQPCLPAGRFTVHSLPFLEAGEKALNEAIRMARPGNRVGDLSLTIQKVIEEAGYYPVRVLTGHGVGKALHEDPLIPGILPGRKEKTPALLPGMTLAIEVIYGEKTGEVLMENDGWTIVTKDGKIAGLFEKTIAVTQDNPLVLTDFGGK